MHSNRTTRGVASRAAGELFEPQVNCLSVAVAVKVARRNAAFSCGGIDGKLGGLTPMNSYARLVCIRGIKITVIGLPR